MARSSASGYCPPTRSEKERGQADGTTGTVNDQAVPFFDDMATRPILSTAFRPRMQDMVTDGELPDAMDAWSDGSWDTPIDTSG